MNLLPYNRRKLRKALKCYVDDLQTDGVVTNGKKNATSCILLNQRLLTKRHLYPRSVEY